MSWVKCKCKAHVKEIGLLLAAVYAVSLFENRGYISLDPYTMNKKK